MNYVTYYILLNKKNMKKIIIVFVLGLFLMSCNTAKECSKKESHKTEKSCCEKK